MVVCTATRSNLMCEGGEVPHGPQICFISENMFLRWFVPMGPMVPTWQKRCAPLGKHVCPLGQNVAPVWGDVVPIRDKRVPVSGIKVGSAKELCVPIWKTCVPI